MQPLTLLRSGRALRCCAWRAFGAVPVPPPPPGPPGWVSSQATSTSRERPYDEGGQGGPGPIPPPPASPPRSMTETPLHEVVKGAPSREPLSNLSSQEKYQQMLQRLHLPLTKEPGTPRPKPEDLTVGFRLRVQWSDGWWKAQVLEMKEDQVKVKFDTWGSEHDEWIAKDSQRLRLALPDDVPAEEDNSESFVSAKVRDRPYVPKPFNPEKEFQKRQLRIREKIAAMQKTKLGFVDPQLSAKMGDEALKTQVPSVPSMESASLTAETSKLREVQVSPEVAALNEKAAKEVLAQAEAPPPPPLDNTLKPQEPDVPPPGFEEKLTSPTEAATVQTRDPVDLPEVSWEKPPKGEASPGAHAVRWEELLTDKKERYYLEVATGQTQWDLPGEGWVALLDDDGSKYYWNTETGTTQWDVPG